MKKKKRLKESKAKQTKLYRRKNRESFDDLELDDINDLGPKKKLRGNTLTYRPPSGGEMIFDNGVLVYLDDGNGNEWCIEDEDDYGWPDNM